MNYHRKELAELIETTFQATQAKLGEEHNQDLRESQSQARRTHNSAALLPAEAASYIKHVRALTVARARTIADAYTAFNESSGEAGERDLTNYYKTVLSARRSAFQGHSELVGRRTGMSLSQLSGLLRKFETDSHAALLEGRSILAKQRTAFRSPPTDSARPAGNNAPEPIAVVADREAKLASDRFWREFIAKARKSPKAEPTLWDFKETLSFWHAKTGDARRREKTKFAADVASFANAEGGCLVIGVTDKRIVVGVSDNPREVENRLTETHKALTEHFSYPRSIYRVRQVSGLDDEGNEKLCFVVAVARACEPAAACDGEGGYTYPVRMGSGTSKGDKEKLRSARVHDKNDSYAFLDELEAFIRHG